MLTPVHPGEILKEEFMLPYGLSSNALARAINVPPNRIAAIINGTRGMSADTALRLGRAFGTTPDFWLNLQNAYDLDMAETSSEFDESTDSVRLHFIKLIRESFDTDTDLSVDARGSDLKIRIDWGMPELDRPNKRSRAIIIRISQDLVEDYLNASNRVRTLTDKRACAFLRSKSEAFVREHNNPRHMSPPSEEWTVSSELMRYS